MSDGLSFFSPTHTYHWEGITVPSVTQIIGEWVPVSVYGVDYYFNPYTGAALTQETFRAAADWGTAVHAMCALDIQGQLDEAALVPALRETLDNFRQWRADFPGEVLAIEKPLYHRAYRYAGTLDLMVEIKVHGWSRRRVVIVDIKTGAHDMAGVQAAAYVMLASANPQEVPRPALSYVLYLPKDGRPYQFKLNKQAAHDRAMFMALLTKQQYMERKRAHGRNGIR